MSKHVSDMCRICLEGDSDINIFRTTALNDLVANLLIDCADVDVSLDDKLPHVICNKCLKLLKTSCELRKQIRSSDIVLRELLEIDVKPEIVVTKEENLQFSLDSDKKPAVVHTYTSPNNEIKAEILSEGKQNIPIVQENHSYPGQGLLHPEEYLVETEIESDEEIAEWILYPQQSSLQPDEASAPAENVNNCCMCKKMFDNFDLLKQHALEDHKKRCHKPITNPGSFLRKYFDCNICSKKFDTEFSLKKHQTAYQTLMACPTCGKMTLASQAKNHAKRHEIDQVECDICNKMFKKIYISEHKKKVHCGSKEWFCHMCPDKAFGTKNYLRNHMVRHDPNFKKQVAGACPHCAREFESMSAMRTHMHIHTGQKRFSCNYCEAKFVHNTDYRRHVWTHEGSPYSCKKCNKYMDRPSHLKAHEAAGCNTSTTNPRRSKPQREDQEKIPYKRKRRSQSTASSESCDSIVLNAFSAIKTDSGDILSYNCSDNNCLETFTSESDFALHMAMHAAELKL